MGYLQYQSGACSDWVSADTVTASVMVQTVNQKAVDRVGNGVKWVIKWDGLGVNFLNHNESLTSSRVMNLNPKQPRSHESES